MFTSYSLPVMLRSQSESWDNEVEPLKIKSALTRRGSKSKLRGPREFSPLIGSTKPKKAVTFDRTDEIITYEQLTPEVHDDWRFDEQEYEIAESFEENPLHVLPSIPEQSGIEKSMSEPSLHATLHANRLSRGDRIDAVMDSSPIPSFRPGHRHNDSWRGSWGTIRDSLGAQENTQSDTADSPHIEENFLFEQLPAVTRKESLQDEQRRPKTINMHANARTSNNKVTLDRTHSQRKRAIRSILESEPKSKAIATITEEDEPDSSRVSRLVEGEEQEEDEEEEQEPPEIPPHSPNPQLTINTSSPGTSPNRVSNQYLAPQTLPISPSLESVATFEAKFASVERAESSFPVLTSVHNSPRVIGGQEFNFEKTRTSTPSSHPLPNAPRRVPSPISEVAETSRELEESAAPSPDSQPTEPVKFENVSSPQVLAPLAPLTPEEPGSETQTHNEPRQARIDSWSRWETTEDVEKAYMDPSSESEVTADVSKSKQLMEELETEIEVSQPSTHEESLSLPEIPNRSSSQTATINLPELSLSPTGLDTHMFDSSGSSLHASHVLANYDHTGSSRAINAENSTAPHTSEFNANESQPLSLADAEVSAISIPVSNDTVATESSSQNSFENNKTQPTIPYSTSQVSMASGAFSTSTSQRSIAGNNTYDFDSSTLAVHEKHYTSTPRPIAVQEEEEEEQEEEVAASGHVDVRQAPSMVKRLNVNPPAIKVMPVEHGQNSEPQYSSHDDLDRILEDSVTQETINISDHDSSVEALRPHPEFSFVETRNVTPLTVSPLVQNEHNEAEAIDMSTYSQGSAISKVAMKKSPELYVASDAKAKSISEKVNVSANAEHSIVYAHSPETAVEHDHPTVGHFDDASLPWSEAASASLPFSKEPQSVEAKSNKSGNSAHLHESTSIEPLVIRHMDISKESIEEPNEDTSNINSRQSSIRREASTNMISPPTPSQAFSNPGSRVVSGASTANNTVLHTPFPDDSLLNYARRPAAPLGFSPNVDSPELQEKHHSPDLIQDDLVLDSDLSEDEAHNGENDWVTETESEFGSNRRIGGFGSSILGSEYSSHIPSRIPTFQAEPGRPISASDIHECLTSERYSTTEPSSQAFGYPSSTGFSTTVPNSSNSRWSVDSIREDSMFSMQLGQSMDDFSADLNRVASTATVDGIDSDTGYVLRENDSLILANSDRIFKTTRRRTTTRRKPVQSAIESLETHHEEAEETNDYDQSLSIRKRNEQTSFATRQPSHIVMSRNVTPQKANRATSSMFDSRGAKDATDANRSAFASERVSSSNYGGSREPSLSTGHRANMSVELPNRSQGEVEPTAKISEHSPIKDSSVHIDVRKAPPPLGRMADIKEVRETPQSVAQEKFENATKPATPEHHHMPRPASSYTPQVCDQETTDAATRTRNKHKSCPIMPKEKGHLFISLDSISGYNLPDGTMNITVDNGEQQITTEPKNIGKTTEFKQEYDLLVHDGLTCDVTIRAFKTETKEKRSNFAKLFKRNKKDHEQQYTPVARDGTIGHCKIHFNDIKQYAFGKPYIASIPCYDRLNMNQTCMVNVKMMYIPIMSRADKLPTSMSEALEEITLARRNKVTAMTGYMVQHGGDCKQPKRRYFILDDDMLIAHSDKSFKARATINLRKAVYLAPDDDDSLKFRVNFRNGAFINFTVESERQKWMEALDATIHNKRNRSSWVSLVVYADDTAIKANGLAPQAVI